MTGCEPRTCSIGIDRSANWATTTAQNISILYNLSKACPNAFLLGLLSPSTFVTDDGGLAFQLNGDGHAQVEEGSGEGGHPAAEQPQGRL